jgi:hypothetical protein
MKKIIIFSALFLIGMSIFAAPTPKKVIGSYLPSSYAVPTPEEGSISGRFVSAEIPFHSLDNLVVTDYHISNTRGPNVQKLISKTNLILSKVKTFSKLTNIPKGNWILWRGYSAFQSKVYRMDFYVQGKDYDTITYIAIARSPLDCGIIDVTK